MRRDIMPESNLRCATELKGHEHWIEGYQYVPWNRTASTSVRDMAFREVNAEFVLCVDSHVLFVPGARRRPIVAGSAGRCRRISPN